MLRTVTLLIVILIGLAGIGVCDPADPAGSGRNVPAKTTPQKLQEAWLHFHETDLCQEVDAVFVFTKGGMEVWSRIESDKSLQKFLGLFEPLKSSYSIELYITRAEFEKKKKEEDDPPPSLWQNMELRSNLGEIMLAQIVQELDPIRIRNRIFPDSVDSYLKARLRIYAEQILSQNKRMERYASDLNAITKVAYDPGRSRDLQSKAIAAGIKHAQSLGKQITKLTASLEQAFPIAEGKKRPTFRPGPTAGVIKDPVEKAAQISEISRSVALRIHSFIYPEEFTVALDDLRHPSLLQSLDSLRGIVLDFEKLLAKPVSKPN